ncbi:MAG: MATE family efflux transporter [Oscillospiraceae bacterium]|nr:MATE family efflux transporter [Oscillospiraceae bacterium]
MAQTKNRILTSGPITRQLLVLAAPLLLGSVLQQLYNAADTLIVQRLAGEIAFSAVGVAGTVMNLFLFIISGACTGISIVMASLYGAGNEKKLRCESWMATIFGLAFTLLIAIPALLLIRPLLALIATPEALMEGAARYLLVILLGMPAAFLYNLGAGALRAVGNTDKATLFLILSVILNIGLDLLFVGPLAMGVTGAALATVLAQLFSALCCLVYIFRYRSFLIFRREDRTIDPNLLRQTAVYSLISALNKSSLYIGKLLVQGVVNTIGLEAIAGFTAGSRIENIANTFAVSGGEALSVFVAQNLGAGERRRAREGFRKWLVISLLSSLIISGLMYVTSGATVGLFLNGSSGMTCGRS